MEDLNINVAKGFGLRWKYITKEKASYLCHTEGGVKIIKKTSSEHRHIVFQQQLKTQLYDRGFRNIDLYGLSLNDTPYFEYNGETYVMTDRLCGKQPDFQNTDDFTLVIETIAKMHRESRGFAPDGAIAFSKYNNIEETFARNIQDMAAIKKKLKKKSSLSDFDVTFIKNYEYYYAQMTEAVEGLQSSGATRSVTYTANICHNLLKEENFFLSQGDIYLTNFSDCSFDCSVFDLADIIRRYMKTLPDDYIAISDIAEAYTRHNPLDKTELALLRPLIIFPGKYVKLCMQHYVKNRSFVPSALGARMKNLTDRQATTEEYLKTF